MSKNYPAGYGTITPQSDYRPWDVDSHFLKVWEIVSQYSKLDIMRGYALWELIAQCAVLPGDVIEVGVWRGGSGALICKRLAEIEQMGTKNLHLCDTFYGVVKAGKKDDYYKGGEHANATPDDVQEVLQKIGGTKYHIHTGIFPEETGESIANLRFCFCHIDVDVYQSAYDTIQWIWARMPIGGIIVLDDYGFWGCEGVTKLCHEIRNIPDRIFIHNLSGQALLIKIA